MATAPLDPGPWTTLHRAPLLELEVLLSALREEGVAAIISDATLGILDPFLRGDSTLDCTLRVPRDQVARAHEVLAELRESGALALRAQLDLPDQHEPTAEERRLGELEALGRRIRWAALLGITWPLAVYEAIEYFAGVRRLGRTPRDHGFTIAALGFVTLGLIASLVYVLYEL